MIDNEALQLGVTISPQNTTERVIFRSSNNAVAVVNASGLVTALSPGEVVITATSQSGKVSASVTVTVLAVNVTKVEFAQDYLLLEVEQSESLSYTVSPQNASNKAVTFASSDEAVATVDATGHVTAVAQGVAQITVTSVENGTLLDTMDIVVVVPKSTIAEAKAASNNTVIRVEGVVTHLIGNSAFIHDGVEGFYLYNARVNFADEVKIGNLITITGSRAVFNNLMQLSNPTQAYVLKTNQPLPTPVVLDSETVMLPLQGAPVSLNGYFISSKATISGTGGANVILSSLEGHTIIVRVDSQTNLTADVRTPIVNYFNGLEVGAFVNVTNAPLGWFSNDPQIMITNVNQLSAGVIPSYNELAAYVASSMDVEESEAVTQDLQLPVTGLFGSTITWQSSHHEVISAAGEVTRPEAIDGDQEVVLTYTIVMGLNDTFTGTLDFVVLAKSAEPEEIVIHNIDFGTTNVTGYAAGNLTFTNGDGKAYTFAKNRVQLNTRTGYSPALVFAPISTAKEAHILLDFSSETLPITQVSFDIYGWTGTTATALKNQVDSYFYFQVYNNDTSSWVTLTPEDVNANLVDTVGNTPVNVVYTITSGNAFRVIVGTPNATSTTNTAYAVMLDNLKIWALS